MSCVINIAVVSAKHGCGKSTFIGAFKSHDAQSSTESVNVGVDHTRVQIEDTLINLFEITACNANDTFKYRASISPDMLRYIDAAHIVLIFTKSSDVDCIKCLIKNLVHEFPLKKIKLVQTFVYSTSQTEICSVHHIQKIKVDFRDKTVLSHIIKRLSLEFMFTERVNKKFTEIKFYSISTSDDIKQSFKSHQPITHKHLCNRVPQGWRANYTIDPEIFFFNKKLDGNDETVDDEHVHHPPLIVDVPTTKRRRE